MIYLLLGRRWVYIALGIFAALLATFFAFSYRKTLGDIERIHNGYKEFLLLLQRAQKPKGHLDEGYLRRVARMLGLNIFKLQTAEGGFRIVFKNLPATKVIPLLAALERAGRIAKFELTDNSGKGNFYAVIVVVSSQ